MTHPICVSVLVAAYFFAAFNIIILLDFYIY
jgi:hypothetical protein